MDIEYYKKIILTKKRFVRSLEQHCSRKREIYKIWAHWLIRTLSKNRENYHVLSKIDPDYVDSDILKHMIQNGIGPATALQGCKDLTSEFNELYREHHASHIELLKSPAVIMQLQDQIIYSVDETGGFGTLGLNNVPVSIKISTDKMTMLTSLYTGPEHLLLFYVFEYCFNYYMLDGKSLQWSIPKKVFDVLIESGLKGELFASPVNHQYPYYHSLFFVDRYFGSQGNFFTIRGAQTVNSVSLQNGLYEVNPPFIEEIFTESSKLLVELLKHRTGPLGFVYIMPQWENLFGYDFLTKSKYFLGEKIVEKNKHAYFQSSNNKYIQASFDTVVLLIGNTEFSQIYNPSQLLSNIHDSFSHPKRGAC